MMTTAAECEGGGAADKAEEAKELSLKSVREKLSRLGSTVKFRGDDLNFAPKSNSGNGDAEESCQPQDLSVKRRNQGSQTDDGGGGGRGKAQTPPPPPTSPPEADLNFAPKSNPGALAAAAALASERDKMLLIYLLRSSSVRDVVLRLAHAMRAIERKSSAHLSKVDGSRTEFASLSK